MFVCVCVCSCMLGSDVWFVSQVVSREFCIIVTGCVQSSTLSIPFFAVWSKYCAKYRNIIELAH